MPIGPGRDVAGWVVRMMDVPVLFGGGIIVLRGYRLSWPVALVLLASGCTGLPHGKPTTTCQTTPIACHGGTAARGVVICVPGAGGFPLICETLAEAIQEQGLPLAVEPFEWTHGYLRVLSDQLDTEHIYCQSQRLASRILALKRECPGKSISILTHSAGCMVTLEAARQLPPNTLDHIILLAPAVSAQYDIRPALSCAARGVDVFYSRRDWFALGVGVALVGTSDRQWGPAAGRVGFEPPCGCPGDEALLRRLRQHPWDWCVVWAGNWGGHYGAYRPQYMRAYVLPLLRDCG